MPEVSKHHIEYTHTHTHRTPAICVHREILYLDSRNKHGTLQVTVRTVMETDLAFAFFFFFSLVGMGEVQKSQLRQQRSRHWIQTALSKQDCDGKSKHALTLQKGCHAGTAGRQRALVRHGPKKKKRKLKIHLKPDLICPLGVCVCIFQGTGLPT